MRIYKRHTNFQDFQFVIRGDNGHLVLACVTLEELVRGVKQRITLNATSRDIRVAILCRPLYDMEQEKGGPTYKCLPLRESEQQELLRGLNQSG